MRAGGVWDCIKPSMDPWGVGGPVIGALAGSLLGLVGGGVGALVGWLGAAAFGRGAGGWRPGAAGGALTAGALGTVSGAVAGHFLGRAFGVLQAQTCYDVWGPGDRSEFAAAFLFKLFDNRARFWWWIEGIRSGRHGAGFPPFLGITPLTGRAQFDEDDFVRRQYLTLAPRFNAGEYGEGVNTAFARAVAGRLPLDDVPPPNGEPHADYNP